MRGQNQFVWWIFDGWTQELPDNPLWLEFKWGFLGGDVLIRWTFKGITYNVWKPWIE